MLPPPPFSFPPDQTCQPLLNLPGLIDTYNAFTNIIKQMKEIRFYNSDTALWVGSTFLQIQDCSTCTASNILQLTETNREELLKTARKYFQHFGGTAKVGISIQTSGETTTIDGKAIVAKGSPSAQHPYLIYSANQPKYASSTDTDPCLCSTTNPTLSAELRTYHNRLENQLELL